MSDIDQSEEEAEAVRCLLSHSGSCYLSLLDGPPQNNTATVPTISGWENVRPCAEYDLTDRRLNSIQRKRKRRPSNQLAGRRAVSLPNIRPPQKRYSDSYMSGHLDENFSYVYTGGLSERADSAEPEQHQKVYHMVDPLFQHPAGGHSYSTRTLTFDTGPIFPGRLAAQIDMRMRREISKLVAMQLKPEILAEQIIIENRLRNLELNAFPVLGAKSESRLQMERGNSVNEVLTTKSDSAPPVAVRHWASLAQQSRRKKKQRKTKPPKPSTFEWCPMGIQECSSTDFRLNAQESLKRETLKHLVTVNSPPIVSPNSTRSDGIGLSSCLGVGALSKKQMTHVKSPKSIYEPMHPTCTQGKEKTVVNKRTLGYFGQEKFAVENNVSGPVSGRHDEGSPGPYRVRVPVIVPTLKQEQTGRTKRLNNGLTTLNQSSTV